MGNTPQTRKRGTTRKKTDVVPEHNGEGGMENGEGATRRRTKLPSVQQRVTSTKSDKSREVSGRALATPERASDRLKRLKLGARIPSQPDNNDFVEDVPLADITAKQPVTRRTTRLSLVHQSGTSTKHNNTEEDPTLDRMLDSPERVGGCLNHSKVGARITGQSDSDDVLDDVPLAELAKKQCGTRHRTRLPIVQQDDRTTEHANTQDAPVSKGSLNEPERVGDLPKHSKVGERIMCQTASDNDVDDVPLSELAKKRYGAQHSASLPLLHQVCTPMNHNNKQDDTGSKRPLIDPERVGDHPKSKRPKCGARKPSQIDSDDFVDDVPRRCLPKITKKRNVKGKSKMADTDIVVEHDLFYVDKVVLSVRSVTRTFPVFRSWSNEALKAREHDEIDVGAFGRGFVDVDFRLFADSRRLDKSGLKYDGVSDVTGVTDGHCVQPTVVMQTEVDVQKVGLSDNTTDMAAIVEDSGQEPDKYVTTGDSDRSPRPKRSTRVTSAVKSPFIERTINVTKKLDGHERMIANWTLKKDVHDEYVCLFSSH
ncbi:ATP synthase subunit a [Striga asiatica]|uniref:ATP synthase subunit a n=1 Tax=Striga asiatica TaxID=4170 RepID=A0A5A7QZ88_STRAF|nr:ATP synthase subunit a [Striga asiatica]